MAVVVILLLAGLLLLALETILPGLVAGAAGLVCLLTSVILAYHQLGVQAGNTVLALVSGLLILGVFLWFRFFPRSRLGRNFVSKGVVGEIRAEQTGLLHHTGTAVTNLRPSGTALIDGRRIDVVTEGAMVEPGSPVRVVAVEGMRVVVRAMDQRLGIGE
jgi:membrane-bound serine protease (ClpP class)